MEQLMATKGIPAQGGLLYAIILSSVIPRSLFVHGVLIDAADTCLKCEQTMGGGRAQAGISAMLYGACAVPNSFGGNAPPPYELEAGEFETCANCFIQVKFKTIKRGGACPGPTDKVGDIGPCYAKVNDELDSKIFYNPRNASSSMYCTCNDTAICNGLHVNELPIPITNPGPTKDPDSTVSLKPCPLFPLFFLILLASNFRKSIQDYF